MRRRVIHAGFAAAALLCAGGMLYQTAEIHRLEGINEAIAAASRPQTQTPPAAQAPRVTLARALALSRAGDVDRAVKEFSRLTARTTPDDTSRAALYDLGNLYLRRGMALSGENASAAVPFVELAKQRYRDLLRIDPEQWDARYNLERALRLAPEAQAVFSDFGRSTEQRPNIAPRDDMVAPELP